MVSALPYLHIHIHIRLNSDNPPSYTHNRNPTSFKTWPVFETRGFYSRPGFYLRIYGIRHCNGARAVGSQGTEADVRLRNTDDDDDDDMM